MIKRKSNDESTSTTNNADQRIASIQILIMTKRLQMFAEDEAKRIEKMNQIVKQINWQQRRLFQLDRERRKTEKSLHFAFMFACPLALSFDSKSSNKLQMIAQLNHRREFQIIKQKLAESKSAISITSQQCTIDSL